MLELTRSLHVLRRWLTFVCVLLSCATCAPTREPIPPGVIPHPARVSAEERQAGEQVTAALLERFPRVNDRRIERRVETIVRRLSAVTGAAEWRLHILQGDEVQNAAATVGNNMFIWTGMLRTVQGDDELAAVLAHEMGHVLARHVVPTADEQINQILTGIAGAAAQRGFAQSFGAAAGIAGSIVQQGVAGLIVNPESQRKELEADRIGLSIMADAGYHPEAALRFWWRAAQSEQGSRLTEFFSTHPASERRLDTLEREMPMALERYRDAARGLS